MHDFSDALHFLEDGEKISRSGWNGKGMYIEKVVFENIEPFLIIVNGERRNTWVPSISDLFARDWDML